MQFVVTEYQVLFKTHPDRGPDPAAEAVKNCEGTALGTEKPSQAPPLSGPCRCARCQAWSGRGLCALTSRDADLRLFSSSASTTGSLGAIQKMTRVRVVDNSALGNTPYHRPPRCIHVYNRNGVGKVGDRILLAIKGQKKKALIVGHRMPGPRMTPRFDSNNVVLIEDNGNPVGTRIKTPIPSSLRQREGEFSKVLAIAQNFV